MSLITYVLPWTIAVYVGFGLLYGETIFDTDFGTLPGCSIIIVDCLATFFGGAGQVIDILFQFITLGGFTSPLGPWVQGILLLAIGLPWFLIAVGIGRGTAVS